MGSHVTDCENCSPPKVISGRFSGFVCGQERASSIMVAGKLYVSRRVFLSLQLTCEKTIDAGDGEKKFILPHFCISHLDRGKRILKWELFWLSLTSWPAANRELELIYYWWWLTSSCSKPLQGKTGKTPLKCVASSGHQDVVELLLNAGASKETVQVYPE